MKQIVDLELYQRVKGRSGFRRIALLPDVDDETVAFIRCKFPQPRFHVRLSVRIFSDIG